MTCTIDSLKHFGCPRQAVPAHVHPGSGHLGVKGCDAGDCGACTSGSTERQCIPAAFPIPAAGHEVTPSKTWRRRRVGCTVQRAFVTCSGLSMWLLRRGHDRKRAFDDDNWADLCA
jgi:hypothetical protein